MGLGRRGCCAHRGPESCKAEGPGSQERGLRARVTPYVQAGSPATEAALAPFPNIQQSLRATRMGWATGPSTRGVQALLPQARFVTREWEKGGPRECCL